MWKFTILDLRRAAYSWLRCVKTLHLSPQAPLQAAKVSDSSVFLPLQFLSPIFFPVATN